MKRRTVCLSAVVMVGGGLGAACQSGKDASFAGSNDPGTNAPVISGKSDTSGVSAGTALQPPTVAPTRAP